MMQLRRIKIEVHLQGTGYLDLDRLVTATADTQSAPTISTR